MLQLLIFSVGFVIQLFICSQMILMMHNMKETCERMQDTCDRLLGGMQG